MNTIIIIPRKKNGKLPICCRLRNFWSNFFVFCQNFFLQKFTEVEGSDKFCLVHLFTYQAFAGGVLGLGYIASPRIGHAGGICGAGFWFTKFFSGCCFKLFSYVLASPGGENGKLIYYNTAFSSLRSTYGSTVVTREADIVTAHGTKCVLFVARKNYFFFQN